ncbi:hypothetical protein TNCV_4193351 [Trichonephila clavipes]|nr:hypothetical protein TNCV_4193351 [Trichonephila clavipes]
MLEFDRTRTIAYREHSLFFPAVTHLTGQNATTVMRIWDQWVAENHPELYAGSLRHFVANYPDAFGNANPCHYIVDHYSENEHACSMPNISSHSATTLGSQTAQRNIRLTQCRLFR